MHYLVPSYGLAATLLLSGVLGACGDSGGVTTETSNGPTTAPSTSEPQTTTGASSTTATASDPTTSPTGTATEATGDVTGSVTGDLTTGGPTTATSSATTGDDTTAGTSDGTTGTTGDGTTGGGEVIPCETDKDCTLADGCCECNPIGPGETPKECDIQCIQSVCASFGLENTPVECRFGRCTFAKVQCNPLGVDCDAPMPDCSPGQVPRVEDTNEGKCWKGCVPAEACDWVPDCTYCSQTTQVCVGKLQKGAYHVCEPKPVDCGDETDIDCGCGEQICEASEPHVLCHDAQDDIDCECPNC
jgi:hypothetical protein